MTQYRYLFADLISNEVLCELPLTGVSFNRVLNATGTLTGSVLLTDPRTDVYEVNNYTTPAKTSLYVDRDGVIVWGGIIWGRSYSSGSQSVTFQAREFESYLEKRRITSTISASVTDQLTLAKTILDNMQAVSYGNINLVVPTRTSGVLVTKDYYDYEQKPVYEALMELSRQNTGFDWNIDCSYDSSGLVVKNVDLAYPRRGIVYSQYAASVSVLEFPGNIVEYEYPEDAGTMATLMHGVGDGTGPGILRSDQTSTSQLLAGFPILEQTVPLTDYSEQSTLDQITLGHLNNLDQPVVVMKVVTEAFNDPVLGTLKQGDDIRLRINDSRFPDGLDQAMRVVSLEVTPGEQGPERIIFSLSMPTE